MAREGKTDYTFTMTVLDNTAPIKNYPLNCYVVWRSKDTPRDYTYISNNSKSLAENFKIKANQIQKFTGYIFPHPEITVDTAWEGVATDEEFTK